MTYLEPSEVVENDPKPYQWHKGAKYYNVHIQPNLFGGASVIKSWGGIGSRKVGSKVVFCEAEVEINKVIEEVTKKRKTRGYKAQTGNICHLTTELLEEIKLTEAKRLKPFADHLTLNINAKDDEGWTVLKWASYYRNKKIVQLLLLLGAKPNIQDQNGCTALMEAAWRGNVDTVKMLIEHGAKVNIESKKLEIALMAACLGGHLEIVKLLIRAKADINVKGLAEYAMLSKNNEVITFIEDNKENKNILFKESTNIGNLLTFNYSKTVEHKAEIYASL